MKKVFFSIFLIPVVLNLPAQRKDSLVCPAMSVNVWACLEGYSPLPRVYLKKEDIQKGFMLTLTDKSYKIIGFKIFFDFYSCPLGDRWIKGNTVTSENFPELAHYKNNIGVLNFPCIIIEKDGVRYKVQNDFFILPLEEKEAVF
jgi:hypothetical protein